MADARVAGLELGDGSPQPVAQPLLWVPAHMPPLSRTMGALG